MRTPVLETERLILRPLLGLCLKRNRRADWNGRLGLQQKRWGMEAGI